jgi:hypothetical protein
VRRATWLLAVLTVGCTSAASATPTPPSRPSSTATLPASPTQPATTETTARPSSSAPEPLPIEEVLPARLGDVELHTFPTGQDILARMAVRLGISPDAFEAAYASEHGARFLQMVALRLEGADSDALAEAWAADAYPPDVTDVTITEADIGGRTITVVEAPSAQSRIGSFYLYPVDGTLFVVQAFERDDAEEALGTLP